MYVCIYTHILHNEYDIVIATIFRITIHVYAETIISAHMHVYMTNNTRTPSSYSSPQNDGP